MLSSVGRIVFALLRFAVGGGLALIGLGLFRHDPRLPPALAHLAAQPPFSDLWWALVALAGGVALMLHALPSPWRTDRLADRGLREVGPAPEPEASPAPPRRTFDAAPVAPPTPAPPASAPIAAPVRWRTPEPDLSLTPYPAIAPAPPPATDRVETRPDGEADAAARAAPPAAFPTPVFRSRPPPRRPARALMIQPMGRPVEQ